MIFYVHIDVRVFVRLPYSTVRTYVCAAHLKNELKNCFSSCVRKVRMIVRMCLLERARKVKKGTNTYQCDIGTRNAYWVKYVVLFSLS